MHMKILPTLLCTNRLPTVLARLLDAANTLPTTDSQAQLHIPHAWLTSTLLPVHTGTAAKQTMGTHLQPQKTTRCNTVTSMLYKYIQGAHPSTSCWLPCCFASWPPGCGLCCCCRLRSHCSAKASSWLSQNTRCIRDASAQHNYKHHKQLAAAGRQRSSGLALEPGCIQMYQLLGRTPSSSATPPIAYSAVSAAYSNCWLILLLAGRARMHGYPYCAHPSLPLLLPSCTWPTRLYHTHPVPAAAM